LSVPNAASTYGGAIYTESTSEGLRYLTSVIFVINQVLGDKGLCFYFIYLFKYEKGERERERCC
jgi:hypothetical protein